MKNKTKVVVALASLLAVTGGIGAYSTFAWFSTTNTAKVTVESLTVYNKGNFKISFATNDLTPNSHVFTAPSNNGESAATYAISSGINNALDISGDGAHFIRPKWASGEAGVHTIGNTADVTKNYDVITNSATSDTVYDVKFISFDMTFKNNGANALSLVLDKGSTVTGASAAGTEATRNNNAAASTRVAFMTSDAAHSLIATWQYSDAGKDTTQFTTSGYGYVSADAAGTAYAKTTEATGIKKNEYTVSTPSAASDKFIVPGDLADTIADTSDGLTAARASGRYLGNIPTTATGLTITCSIWIEGTAKTATDDIIGGVVNTAMQFTGLSTLA
jgi:hypothetical protein